MTTSSCITPVGIGELVLAPGGSGGLSAYALGSCVGIAVWAPDVRWGGIAHIQLPASSSGSPQMVKDSPCRFADIAVPMLFKRIYDRHAQRRSLQVVIAGGARVGTGNDPFSIGMRNVTVVRKLLWTQQIVCRGEDTLGEHPRTLRLDLANGQISITGNGVQTIY